jgi:L-threonylcarbamoyladenylate synthase
MNFDLDDLKKAVDTLKKGGVILYPTDTIWGLGCDATNQEAVDKIFSIKGRENNKPLLVLTDSESRIYNYVEEFPDVASMIIEAAVKPITIIYDKARGFADGVCGSDGSLGIRITNEEFSAALCRRFGKPIISTSANVSGEKSPSNYEEISEDIKKKVDYIVSYRRDDTTESLPSEIVKVSGNGEIKIIRKI